MTLHDIDHELLPTRLVVGVDAAGLSDDAVVAGVELGDALRLDVDLVHAVALPDYPLAAFEGIDESDVVRFVTERARTAVNARARGALAHAATNDEARSRSSRSLAVLATSEPVRIVIGQPAQVLLDAALDDAWIVLGEHRRRALLDLDFSNTARAVLARARRGVWLQKSEPTPIRRILAPIDLSPDSLHALAVARTLAREIGAALDVLYCFDAARWAVIEWPGVGGYTVLETARRAEVAEFERALSAFDWQGVAHTQDFVDGAAARTILARAPGRDLIALGRHGRSGFAASVLGGVVYSVARAAEQSVLVIPPPTHAGPRAERAAAR